MHLSTSKLGIIAILLLAAYGQAAQRDTSVSVAPGSDESVSWMPIDNDQNWTLTLQVKASYGKFKVDKAKSVPAGIERWNTTKDTSSLIEFTGTVSKNHDLGIYQPEFSGEFEPEPGEGGGGEPSIIPWRVRGTIRVLDCAHEVDEAEANGFPAGVHGILPEDGGIVTYEIDVEVTSTARLQDVDDQLHHPKVGSFNCSSIGYNFEGSKIQLESKVECPECKQKTWYTARFKYATYGSYTFSTEMPNWKQQQNAGPNANA